MEIGGSNTFGHSRGQSFDINGNTSSSNSLAWDVWELSTSASRMDWTSSSSNHNNNNNTVNNVFFSGTAAESSGGATRPEDGTGHALIMQLNPRYGEGGAAVHDGGHVHHQHQHQQQPSALYGSDGLGSHLHPDPHLVCLKLGKRHYFEDTMSTVAAPPLGGEPRVAGFPLGKRGKAALNSERGGGDGGGASSSLPGTVPRCQVEGCHVALVNAKDYHRRHKVCEMHSKAPKVVVLGLEQRFCQQCSRFHVVSEFEESKRSCKRRLAGHNERRRKSSHDSIARNSSHHDNKVVLASGRFPYLSTPTGRALSLLSSKTTDSWVPQSDDLSSRSSAALRELIAENRAAVLARQLVLDRDSWHSASDDYSGEAHHHREAAATFGSIESSSHHHYHHVFPDHEHHHGWQRFNESATHLTLDLMQAPTSATAAAAFGTFVSARGKPKAEEEDSSDHLWNSFQGPSLV